MRGGVRVAAGVVGRLPRFGDDGYAGNPERVDAHRLRFVAWSHRRAAARKAHDAAADSAEEDGLIAAQSWRASSFQLIFSFIFVVSLFGCLTTKRFLCISWLK